MQRILKWLETKFSGHSAAVEVDEPYSRVKSHEPGKNVLIPDKYVSNDTITQPALRILDGSSLGVSESTGFDPYNSGSFDTSKSWDSRSRK